MRFASLLLAIFSCVVTSTAQVAASSNTRSGVAVGFSGQAFFPGTPVTGAPYSAQRITEHVQVGADGTRFTSMSSQETFYRDSQGRTRPERPFINGPNTTPEAPLLIVIEDPVARVSYTLDTRNKVAHRVSYSSAPVIPSFTQVRSGTFMGSIPPPAPPGSLPPPAGVVPST